MPDHLAAASKRRHHVTRARAEQALLALASTSEPITFAAVARRAEVSTDFLYSQPDLRAKINDLRAQRRGPTSARSATAVQLTESTSSAVRALSSQLKELKRRHADEVKDLRKALEVAQGENLKLRRRLAQPTRS